MKTEVKLGSLVQGEAARDAIHIAVAPVSAAEIFLPGQDVGLDQVGCATLAEPHVGIVDPFLRDPVQIGQRFYLVLYPNTITSLRHEWTHPAFASARPVPAADKTSSEGWLRQYAIRLNPYNSPEDAFANLLDGLRSGNVHAHGTDLYDLSDLGKANELKEHAECYLGRKINWDTFTFSCSC